MQMTVGEFGDHVAEDVQVGVGVASHQAHLDQPGDEPVHRAFRHAERFTELASADALVERDHTKHIDYFSQTGQCQNVGLEMLVFQDGPYRACAAMSSTPAALRHSGYNRKSDRCLGATLSQNAMRFHGRIGVDAHYNGLALDASEGARIATAMDGADVAFLGTPVDASIAGRVRDQTLGERLQSELFFEGLRRTLRSTGPSV